MAAELQAKSATTRAVRKELFMAGLRNGKVIQERLEMKEERLMNAKEVSEVKK